MNHALAEQHAAHLERRAKMAARAVPDRPIALARPSVVATADVLPMVRKRIKPAAVPTNMLPAASVHLAKQADAHVSAYTRHIIGHKPTAPALPLIIAAAARVFRVEPALLMSPCRKAHAVRPRQLAMFLAKEMTGKSLPEIGRRFGGRDHTTVLHALKKVERIMHEPMVAARIAAIRADIAANSTARP